MEQVRTAQDANLLAQASAKASERQSKLDQRAWLGSGDETYTINESGPIESATYVTNSGKTPAFNIICRITGTAKPRGYALRRTDIVYPPTCRLSNKEHFSPINDSLLRCPPRCKWNQRPKRGGIKTSKAGSGFNTFSGRYDTAIHSVQITGRIFVLSSSRAPNLALRVLSITTLTRHRDNNVKTKAPANLSCRNQFYPGIFLPLVTAEVPRANVPPGRSCATRCAPRPL